MKKFLKVYKGILKVCGPVFVGDGQEINKKEYIYDKDQRKVMIPRLADMYRYLRAKHLAQAYEKYMLNDNSTTLTNWMWDNRVSEADMKNWIAYSLDCGDAIWERGKTMEIKSFVKDAYGCPYVPGSSIKGMLRTILLAYDIQKNERSYSGVKRELGQNIGRRESRNKYLKRETTEIEQIAFHKGNRTEKVKDIVNDIMSGLIVSDSEPLTVNDLTLCQKIEYHIDGSERRLNLLRECLKPGVEIRFTISIDESICKTAIQDIEKALQTFNSQYYKMFSSKFPDVEEPKSNTVWLGGGAGYVSKTIIYNLFGDEGIRLVPKIYQNTNVPKKHGHDLDEGLGVSPHILKKTKYRGRDYQFGECELSFSEIE